MYFLSLEPIHVILATLFLLITLGTVFFRYGKYMNANVKTVNYTVKKRFFVIRLICLLLSILLIGIVILWPAGLMRDKTVTPRGIDCIWLLDVSASMDAEDATDGDAITSRLVAAKGVIESYIVSHPENRYGLVIFAGKSRLISPLTSEHSSLLSFLASIDSKSIREGGTDFREALSTALDRFETKDMSPHAIVLLSDGWDKEDSPDPSAIRDIFLGKHANLITVGLGQTKPAMIPVGRDPIWDTLYKKFQGETVLTSLNRESLENLASIGKWSFLEWNPIQKKLEKSLSVISSRDFQETWDSPADTTAWVFMLMSFLFFLSFLLFPSSFLKRWNAL